MKLRMRHSASKKIYEATCTGRKWFKVEKRIKPANVTIEEVATDASASAETNNEPTNPDGE